MSIGVDGSPPALHEEQHHHKITQRIEESPHLIQLSSQFVFVPSLSWQIILRFTRRKQHRQPMKNGWVNMLHTHS
jgi:hypothetical protein